MVQRLGELSDLTLALVRDRRAEVASRDRAARGRERADRPGHASRREPYQQQCQRERQSAKERELLLPAVRVGRELGLGPSEGEAPGRAVEGHECHFVPLPLVG